MTGCCGKTGAEKTQTGACSGGPKQPCWLASAAGDIRPALEHFSTMIPRCMDYVQSAKAAGKPIVGIMCEYTPRELIMAAGGVPVCLCGGSEKTIPPAEEILPSNLCPLIKSSFGYHLLKNNPLLEMCDLIVAETTCDGKKKMYELMSDTRAMHILELPQKQDDADAAEHWLREVIKLKQKLEEAFKVELTDERLREAVALMNRERGLRRKLAGLMKPDTTPFTGRQLLELKSSISGMAEDLAQYESLLVSAQGGAVAGNGKPVRVLMTGVPIVHGAERVLEIVESAGGLVVCMENCTGLKPILEDVDESASDLLRAVADKYLHLPCSVQTINSRRLEVLEQLVNEYRPQCIIELIWQACLTYDVEAARIKELSDKLHLPYLRINTDYSPSDTARITVRVEALFETIRSAAPQACCGCCSS